VDKKLIFVAGPVILVIIAAAIFFGVLNKPQQTQEPLTTSVNEPIESSEESLSGSILSLLSQGRNLQCTFSRSDENGDMSGKVFLDGERMYGEFMGVMPDGQQFDTYMIRGGDFAYAWQPSTGQGTKIKIIEDESESDKEKSDSDKTLEEDFDYKCSSWVVDNSKFNPPANIEFTDLSAQMEKLEEAQGQIPNIDSSVCDQLAGDAKQQCLDALGGN